MHSLVVIPSVFSLAKQALCGKASVHKQRNNFKRHFNVCSRVGLFAYTHWWITEAYVPALWPQAIDCFINELRYLLFWARDGGLESEQLPPWLDCLHYYPQRASYQAELWKRSLSSGPQASSPIKHNWSLQTENGNKILVTSWMTVQPAPDDVFYRF